MATANRHGIKEGDIMVASWGYDQTNVDAYQVLKATRVMVVLRQVAMEIGSDRRVRPLKGRFADSEELRRKTHEGTREPWVAIADYVYAYKWDGERSYHDTLAAGQPGH